MIKTVSISDITKIRTGYTFRKAESGSEDSGLRGLQISDIRYTRVVDPSRLSIIQWQGKGEPSVLKPGEVVLAAKGNHNRAALFSEDSGEVLASNQFLILSIRDRGLLSPEFLCWILNYPDTQKGMEELQSGSSIPSISKKALWGLTIPLPPLQAQEKILRLNELWVEEARLHEALIANRATQLQGLFQSLLSGDKQS